MEGLIAIWNYLQPKMGLIIDAVAYLVLGASVIVKLTPTLKDDNYFKGIVKFVGKYIALDKYGPKGDV
jgi:hypothetical protein